MGRASWPGPELPFWEAHLDHRLSRPRPGYTPNTEVTEWLTLNCRGDWASRAPHQGRIFVRFFSQADWRQAQARFAPASPCAPRFGGLAAFRHDAPSGDGP